jgi:hypothetical protein
MGDTQKFRKSKKEPRSRVLGARGKLRKNDIESSKQTASDKECNTSVPNYVTSSVEAMAA